MDDVGEVRSRVWRDGVVIDEDFDFERISEYLGRHECLFWVDLCAPGAGLLARLADELSLDPQAVEDALGHAERAKATRYASHTFLTAYATRLRLRRRRANLSSSAPAQGLARVGVRLPTRTDHHTQGPDFAIEPVVAPLGRQR